MSSILQFSRFHFEPVITAITQEEEKLKNERDKQKLLNIISFETDINQYLQGSKYKTLSKENISWQFGG